MIPPFARLHGYDAKLASEEEAIDTGSDTLVQQHLGREVDINVIVKRYMMTGEWPVDRRGPGTYGDFTDIPEDFAAIRARVAQAEDLFMSLPAEERELFDNDVAKLLEFLAQDAPVEEPTEEAPSAPPGEAV